MKENLKKAGRVGLATLIGFMPFSGCKDDIPEYKDTLEYRKSVDYSKVAEKIREIAVFLPFGGRRMNYEEFTEITGIKRTLPEEYNKKPVWVDVGNSNGVEERFSNYNGAVMFSF